MDNINIYMYLSSMYHICTYIYHLSNLSLHHLSTYLISTFFYYRKHGFFDKLNENNKASSNDKNILLWYPCKSLYLIQIDIECYKKNYQWPQLIYEYTNVECTKHFYITGHPDFA